MSRPIKMYPVGYPGDQAYHDSLLAKNMGEIKSGLREKDRSIIVQGANGQRILLTQNKGNIGQINGGSNTLLAPGRPSEPGVSKELSEEEVADIRSSQSAHQGVAQGAQGEDKVTVSVSTQLALLLQKLEELLGGGTSPDSGGFPIIKPPGMDPNKWAKIGGIINENYNKQIHMEDFQFGGGASPDSGGFPIVKPPGMDPNKWVKIGTIINENYNKQMMAGQRRFPGLSQIPVPLTLA